MLSIQYTLLAKERRKKSNCLNCDKALQPWMNYCPKCGQENHVRRASIRVLSHDFLQDYWTFDSKLFKSIIPLLFKPGFLSKEFIEGRRVRYIPPIRMYLFISFIFFLVTSFLEQKQGIVKIGLDENKKIETVDTLKKDDIKMDSIISVENEMSTLITKKSDYISTQEGQKNMNLQMNKNFPFILFIMIPILAFVFFLFFRKKGYYYVDYLIYSLHLQSFIFIWLLIFIPIRNLFHLPELGFITLAIVGFYTFISLKNVYQFGYLSTFGRLILSTIVYGIFFSIVLTISILIIMFLVL